MIATGEKMEAAGDKTAKAGCSVTTFVITVVVLLLFAALAWAVGC